MSRRLTPPRCPCGNQLSRKDRAAHFKICVPCERRVEQDYRKLMAERGNIEAFTAASAS